MTDICYFYLGLLGPHQVLEKQHLIFGTGHLWVLSHKLWLEFLIQWHPLKLHHCVLFSLPIPHYPSAFR